MNDIESKNLCRVFYPKGMSIDIMDMQESIKWNNKNKYSFLDKSKLLSQILLNNNISDEKVVQKLKKCLPNGKNRFLSYSDSEYELLKKEFNI